MKIAPRQAEAFIRAPDAAIQAVLIYGPDTGLVNERAKRLLSVTVPDADDPFAVTALEPGAIKSDPTQLLDAASAMSLTGGAQAVRVQGGADALTAAFKSFLEDAPVGCARVIVESASLGPRSSLRKLFEGADNAAALACYEDDARTLETVVREVLAAANLTPSRDAMAYLVANLGGDRGMTRSELDKLVLYMGGAGDQKSEVTLADAQAAIGDSAAMSVEDVVLAAASGNYPKLEGALARALNEGVHPVQIVRAAERHFQRLHLASAHMARGKSPADALKSLRPPPIFKIERELQNQLRLWSGQKLGGALQVLSDTEVELKSTGLPHASVIGRTLMRLAGQARRAA